MGVHYSSRIVEKKELNKTQTDSDKNKVHSQSVVALSLKLSLRYSRRIKVEFIKNLIILQTHTTHLDLQRRTGKTVDSIFAAHLLLID